MPPSLAEAQLGHYSLAVGTLSEAPKMPQSLAVGALSYAPKMPQVAPKPSSGYPLLGPSGSLEGIQRVSKAL